MGTSHQDLTEFAPGAVWLVDYPVRYAGSTFSGKMTVIRLGSGKLILHSPCAIPPELKAAIEAIGEVGWLVAPGNFHHLHIAAAKHAFPEAEIWIAPGVDKKQPALVYDGMLGDDMPQAWRGEIEQQFVGGNRVMSEVVFLHAPSRTLIVTDLIELIGPETKGVDKVLKFWWKYLTFMWNKPRPAPEYSMFWKSRKLAAKALRQVLDWKFDRIVIAHGDLITENAHAIAEEAWARVLKHG